MDTTQKIRDYVQESRSLPGGAAQSNESKTDLRIGDTVRELQERVARAEARLEQLRSQCDVDIEDAARASDDPRERIRQLLALKDACEEMMPTVPFLPSPGSILPALLAARTLARNVQGSKEAIALAEQNNASAEATLRLEEANLHDANLLTEAMEARIARLQAQHEDRSQKTPAQLARELIAAKRARKDKYDTDMQRFGDAMNNFINDYLSSMLAAEELGGPVVGDMLDVEDDTLAAGFTKKGKAKSTKKPLSDKTRQKRIDQIWGSTAAAGIDVGEEEQPTEAEAADAEMRQLIGNLFATLIGKGGGKAYFQLERDSAASRFLVRAKIAQFHPRDANKLRLIDFGKELDD